MSDAKPSEAGRGARTISKIVDAAARLFGTEGYQGATMQSVARAAGVSKGLLHYHFDSKQHLLIAAQRATFRQIHRRMRDRFQRGERGVDPALGALDALWEAVREMRSWTPFMVEVMSLQAGARHPSPDVADFYGESMRLLEDGIREVFQDDPSMPADRMAWMVRTALHGMIVELALARTDADLARLDQTYTDMRDTFGAALRAAEARRGAS
jgi:AcrR family transcriptional regulator